MEQDVKLAEATEFYKQALAEKVISCLERNNMSGFYVKTREEARDKALSLIPEGAKVGAGGSLTLEQTGIIQALRSEKYGFVDRRKPGLSKDEMTKLRRETLLADVLLMSTNALTMDGKLVNIDGYGNRVAALAYGPKKVIIVAGINKIVPDVQAGLDRIKSYTTPIHTRRRGFVTPCSKTGRCVDCRVEGRICNITTIVEFQDNPDRITVIVCGEELGL